MVRAILDGKKHMTRRVVKGLPDDQSGCDLGIIKNVDGTLTGYGFETMPYQPGDVLWVRETTYLFGQWVKNGLTKTGKQKYRFAWDKSKPVIYAADSKPDKICKNKSEIGYFKRPSIFMPKAAARIWLKVTDVRCERLQDITDQDCEAEGVRPSIDGNGSDWQRDENGWHKTFRQLWDHLNQKRGYPFSDSPWVWVISFDRCDKPGEDV